LCEQKKGKGERLLQHIFPIHNFYVQDNSKTIKKPGNDLLSHSAPRAVPSALKSLTSVFGMGTGVASSLWLPGNIPLKIQMSLSPLRQASDAFALNKLYGQASRSISTG
jgi:hypothetical protein